MAKATKSITLREWQATLDSYLEQMRRPGKTDKDIAEIDKWFEQETRAALRMPVRSLDDLMVLAAVAAHWNAPLDEPAGLDKRSVASVINGILDLGGVRLVSDGRLVSDLAR